MKDELEIIEEVKSPFKIGLVTYISFLTMGLVPLLIYVFDFISPIRADLFLYASVLTGIAFIIVGALKAYVNQSNYLRAIAETVILGAVAAIMAYFVRDLIEGIVRG